ncbi:MAG TPA: response regulator, partial [Thermoanaerobaculia bacterium]|nr:response regulator [Thermoanaerobaculia bacterium]
SEFVVRLPLASPPAASAEPAADEARPLRSRRVLVVDDNRDSADSLALLLEMVGEEVAVAYDGEAALKTAETFQPEVVLLDLGLPKLNGFEAARRLRQREGGTRPVLIALTGWGQEDDRRRSRDAGFDFHITKPVDFQVLKGLLARLDDAGVAGDPGGSGEGSTAARR